MSQGVCRMLMWVGLVAGFASIVASVVIWIAFKTDDRAHAERFGIFVGLWAPTFFVLANWVGIRGTQIVPAQVTTTLRWFTSIERLHMGLILLIVVLLLVVGGLPTWGYSRKWGYGPSGGLGLLLIILLVLVLMGVIPRGF